LKERFIAYGRFDCKNERGYAELLAVVEYEDIMKRGDKGELEKIGERVYGCYDILGGPGLRKGLYFRTLSVLIDDSRRCYGKYPGFRIYEAPREIGKEQGR